MASPAPSPAPLSTCRHDSAGFSRAANRWPPRVAATVALLAGGLTACSPGAVRAEPPRPSPPARAACASLVADLPDRLDGQARRTTVPSSGLTAAWGDPAIILRCGVDVPAAYGPTAELSTVNGVDWSAYLQTSDGGGTGCEITSATDHLPSRSGRF